MTIAVPAAGGLLRVALGVAAVVLGALFAIQVAGTYPGGFSLTLTLVLLVGLSFAGAGVYVWGRRPHNPLGRLMVVLGLVWLLARCLLFAPHPVTFPLGTWLADAWILGLAYFLLTIPSGRLAHRRDLWILALLAVMAVPLEFWRLLVLPPSGPGNALALFPDAQLASSIEIAQRLIAIASGTTVAIVLTVRFARSSTPARRASLPAVVGAFAMLLSLLLTVMDAFTIDVVPLLWAVLGTYVAVPLAAVAVILRAVLARGAIADLIVDLGSTPTPARLRESLAHALGDASLRVAYWSDKDEAFLDEHGAPLDTAAPPDGTATILLERDGAPIAAISHDASLLDDPGLVASLASALRLAVENEKLHAQVEAQLDEVQASRARIVDAADAERRRLERDLHDGAQQLLVSLALSVRLARARLGPDADPALAAELDQASTVARDALAELRDLARGIHPRVLTDVGLGAAIQSLAARSPVDVSVEDKLDRRFPAAIESAAYFVVSESLANVAKYAQANQAVVRTTVEDGWLQVEVADDGVGGAEVEAGSGLSGLADRLAALRGTLAVTSPLGRGTRVVARIPLDDAATPG